MIAFIKWCFNREIDLIRLRLNSLKDNSKRGDLWSAGGSVQDVLLVQITCKTIPGSAVSFPLTDCVNICNTYRYLEFVGPANADYYGCETGVLFSDTELTEEEQRESIVWSEPTLQALSRIADFSASTSTRLVCKLTFGEKLLSSKAYDFFY